MNLRTYRVAQRRCFRVAVGAACTALAGAALVSLVAAEELQPAPSAETPGNASPDPAKQPGVFSSIGEWIDTSISNAAATLKGTREATDAAGAVAKDAVESIVQLPAARIVSGREVCEASANRSADCERAAENLCRSKGLGSMGSLDIQTVQKCPPRVWTTGRTVVIGECRDESYVLRAWCR